MAATVKPVYENQAVEFHPVARRDRVVDVPKPKARPPISAERVPTLRQRKKLLAKKMQNR